jgi:hypothetical protein
LISPAAAESIPAAENMKFHGFLTLQ